MSEAIGGNTNAITTIPADKTVTNTLYYNTNGVRIEKPFNGMFIQVNCHADGSRTVIKRICE